ncbi:MAG: prolipoprotein diacylglyceryl transferase [Sedimentisphaerales bacterium]|nr:prolipoprotein diacylglyceryl transferase [Sedimentisphaerales bacterium]
MRPELFNIPFLNIPIQSYGAMIVLGFISALTLARWRCRKAGQNPDKLTSFAVYILFAGVIGAHLMHVFHNWDTYPNKLLGIINIFSGLEFLGGVVLAILVAIYFFKRHRLPALTYLDILTPSVMLGLAFGRIGCLLNGCCWGAPCDLPWAVRFPAVVQQRTLLERNPESGFRYSYPYEYQLKPDIERGRDKPLIELPNDYYLGYYHPDGTIKYYPPPLEKGESPYKATLQVRDLNPSQIKALRDNLYPMHKIHPTQIYSSINAFILCGVLNLAWRKRRPAGQIFAYMLILYGITRFFIEALRVEPLMFDGLSVSQNISLASILTGIVLVFWLRRGRICEK